MPSTLQNSWMAESRYQDILLDKLPDCISRNLFKRGRAGGGGMEHVHLPSLQHACVHGGPVLQLLRCMDTVGL